MKLIKKIYHSYISYNKEEIIVRFIYAIIFFNVISMIFKLVLGIIVPSVWFLIMAVYYLLLSFVRIRSVLDYKKLKKSSAYSIIQINKKNYLNNGIILILLSVVQFISSAVVFNGGNVVVYSGYIVYGVAFISFYEIGIAIYGLVKYRKNNNKIITAIKITNFVNALVAILTTQIVLLSEFSSGINLSFYNALASG